MGSNRLEVTLAANTKPLNDALKQVDKTVKSSFSAIESHAKMAAGALAALGAGGDLLGKTFIDQAASLETLQAKMVGVTGSVAKAREEIEKLQQFTHANHNLFSLEEVEKAQMTLKNLTHDADTLLPIVAGLGAQFGDLDGKATLVAQAWNGNAKGLKAYQRECQVSTETLVQFGAHVDETGKITVKGAANLDAFRKAMVAIEQSKHGDAVARQADTLAGAMTELSNSFKEFEAEAGKALLPTATAIVKSISGMVEEFRALPDETKGMIAWGAMATGVVGTVGAAVVGCAATVGPLVAGLATAGVTAAGASAALAAVCPPLAGVAFAATVAGLSFAPVVAGLVAVGGAGIYMVHSMGEANKAAAQTLKMEDQQLGFYRKERDVIVSATKAIKDHGDALIEDARSSAQADLLIGKTDFDITKAILGQRELQRAAEESKNQAKVAEIEKTIKFLELERDEMRGTGVAAMEAAEKTKNAEQIKAEAAASALEAFQKNKQAGVFINKREELAALDEVLAGLKQTHKTTEDNYNKLKATKDGDKSEESKSLQSTLEEEKRLILEHAKMAREAREEEAKEALKKVEEDSQLGKISKSEEASRLKDLAGKYGDLAEFKRDVNFKAEQSIKSAIEDRFAAEVKTSEATRSLLDAQQKSIEDRIKRGEDLKTGEAELIALIKERADAEQDAIVTKAALEKSKQSDPRVRAEIEKQAQREIAKVWLETDAQIAASQDFVRRTAADRIETDIDVSRGQKAIIDAQVESLKRKVKEGENVGHQLDEELKKQHQIEDASFRLTLAKKLSTETDPAKRVQLELESREQLTASQKRYAETVKKTHEEEAASRAKDHLEALALSKREHDEKLAQMAEHKAAGKDTTREEASLAREATDLKIKEIQARLASNEVGKSAAEQARLQREAELDILQARRDGKKALEALNTTLKAGTDELNKQKDALKGIVDELAKLKGEKEKDEREKGPLIGGIEEMAKAQQRDNRIAELESKRRMAESDIGDQEASRKSAAANQSEGDRTGKTFGGQTPAELIRQAEVDAIESARRKKDQDRADSTLAAGRSAAEAKLRDMGKSPEEIEQILGVNFKPAPSDAKKEADPARTVAAKKGIIPGAYDPAIHAPAPGSEDLIAEQKTTNDLLRQILNKEARVRIDGGRPATEQQLWQYTTNKT